MDNLHQIQIKEDSLCATAQYDICEVDQCEQGEEETRHAR